MKNIFLALIIFYSSGAIAKEKKSLLDVLKAPGDLAAEVVSEDAGMAPMGIASILPSPKPEQRIFMEFFNSGNFVKSLYQWDSAFGNSDFASTANGKAFKALILFLNGMESYGLNQLFKVQGVTQIHPELVKLWRQYVPYEHKAWNTSEISWATGWDKVFGRFVQAKVQSSNLDSSMTSTELKKLMLMSKAKSPERYFIQWKYALSLALDKKVNESASLIVDLLNQKQNAVSKDLLNVTLGRLLFGQGYLTPAETYYSKVGKRSDYWFVAQEEKAWAQIRKGEPAQTIGTTKSLLKPAFGAYVGPESVFLSSLAHLKLCDYAGVLKDLSYFKSQFKPKLQNLMPLAQGQKNEDITQFIEMTLGMKKSKKIKKSLVKVLPSYVFRDEVTAHLVQNYGVHLGEANLAQDLYKSSLSEGTSKVGFQGEMGKVSQKVRLFATTTQANIIHRAHSLAEQEIAEIKRVLNKMHIVEAEVMQQMTLLSKDSPFQESSNTKLASTSIKGDTVSMPASQEEWFDEIGSYNIKVEKGCRKAI